MREYEVKLFILGLPITANNTRTEIIKANSQDEAEEKAHDWYVSDGWGVYGSRPVLHKGDLVKWNDPAISDYDEEDREQVKNRIFEIVSDVTWECEEDEIVTIAEVGGGSEAEVYIRELELTDERPLKVKAFITKADIKKAEQILIDNGIEADEADTVLQAIGYALLNTELYGNDVSIELHNAKN